MARFTPYQSPRAIIVPTKEAIDAIEGAMRWAEYETPSRIPENMYWLTYLMALQAQGIARKMSFGPEDPSGAKSNLAWKLPVRRITGRYYTGWKLKQLRDGWMVYNDSREAYFIEFGINWRGGNRRIRRPVRKLTMIKTLRFMATTQAYHRIFCSIFISRRHVEGFTQVVQPPNKGTFAGPGVPGGSPSIPGGTGTLPG